MTDAEKPEKSEKSAKSKPDAGKAPQPVETQDAAAKERKLPGRMRPVAGGLTILLLAGGLGFGIGYLSRGGGSGPDLSEAEAFAQSRELTREEIGKAMAREGFRAGKRSGRSHGIIAGGMAAESAVTIIVREQAAAAAQSEAASAQSELAGISSGPPPPTP